jgi:hypothetical protein
MDLRFTPEENAFRMEVRAFFMELPRADIHTPQDASGAALDRRHGDLA